MQDTADELMQIPDEQLPQKADALVDVPITILDVEYIDTSDGRTHVQQMLVRNQNHTLGLYWTPSKWVARVLEDWFTKHPRKELHVILSREPIPNGGFKWGVRRDTDTSTPALSADASPDAQADIPF